MVGGVSDRRRRFKVRPRATSSLLMRCVKGRCRRLTSRSEERLPTSGSVTADGFDETGGCGRSLPQEVSRRAQSQALATGQRPGSTGRFDEHNGQRRQEPASCRGSAELVMLSPAAAPSARSRATPRAARRRSGAEGGGGVPVAARSASSRTSAGMGAGRGHRTRLDGTEQLGPRPACGARFTNPPTAGRARPRDWSDR